MLDTMPGGSIMAQQVRSLLFVPASEWGLWQIQGLGTAGAEQRQERLPPASQVAFSIITCILHHKLACLTSSSGPGAVVTSACVS